MSHAHLLSQAFKALEQHKNGRTDEHRRALELMDKWFIGMSDNEMVEFERVLEKLLKQVKWALY